MTKRISSDEGRGREDDGSRPSTLEKRKKIIEVAMRHFAERGYEGARAQDIATELGMSKGSLYQHFGSKRSLFLACYEKAVRTLPSYLDAPAHVTERGFFETLRYWLDETPHLVREDWIPYRVTLLGNYGADLDTRRGINRFLLEEDPYRTREFVRRGIERGEIRTDIAPEIIVAVVGWLTESFQDALVADELDPGLFRRHRDRVARERASIEELMGFLHRAIGRRDSRA